MKISSPEKNHAARPGSCSIMLSRNRSVTTAAVVAAMVATLVTSTLVLRTASTCTIAAVFDEALSSPPMTLQVRTTPTIPHRLVFLDTRYTSPEEMPKLFYDNIMKTKRHYQTLWGEDDSAAPLVFLGDNDCQQAINTTMPELLPFYAEEKKGKWRANICRIAALMSDGGYYFDTDMESVKPVQLDQDTVFATSMEHGHKGLFNSFIASVPEHPILHEALNVMLSFYRKNTKTRSHNMGTSTLLDAFLAVPPEKRGKTVLMNEVKLDKHPLYLDFPRQVGKGCCCNYAVEDPGKSQIHFYSRFVGAGENCEFQKEEKKAEKRAAPKNKVGGTGRLHTSLPWGRRSDRMGMSPTPLSKTICATQDLPNPIQLRKEMNEAKSLRNSLSERCHDDGTCRMKCGDNDNFMVPMPPEGTLLSIHQATAIWCSLHIESKRLGRPANLLVWGLGNDSPFWAKSTSGRVVFIENNQQWFSKMEKTHPGLEKYLVQYDTSIQRDIPRLGTEELKEEVSHVLDDLPLNDTTWDVFLADAPNGCSIKDVGRFASIYTSKALVAQQGHGHIFVDDYQRSPERRISDFVLDASSEHCAPSGDCGKRVAVWDRIHPASEQYIEKLAMFSFGASVEDSILTAMQKVVGAKKVE